MQTNNSNRASSVRAVLVGFQRRLLASAAMAMAMLASQPAMAITTVYSGPSTGGLFNDDANWSLGSPGVGDLGIFNDATNVDGTITFDADVTNFRTFVQNTAGTIAFDVGEYKWTMSDYMLVGAASAPGFPKIRHIGGEIEALQLLLGTEESGPNPYFEVTGSGTRFHTTRGSGGYDIGLQSSGATMHVHNGATMSADGQTIIGLVGSSDNTLTIEGEGTKFIGGNYLGIGHTGSEFGPNATNNRAEILNSATASASHVYMAITAGAPDNSLLVSGEGTKLSLLGVNGNDGTPTYIGWRASNNLFTIEDGAVVDGTNYFALGVEATSSGNQLVIDNGTLAGTGLEIIDGSVSVTNGTIDLFQYFNEGGEVYEGGGIIAENGAASTFTFNSGMVSSVNANINNGSAFTVGDGGSESATYHMKLGIGAPAVGDYNQNGSVDVADYTVWRDMLNQTGEDLAADGDDSGTVDQGDYNVWAMNFGQGSAGVRGTHTFANGLSLSSNGVLSGEGDIVGNVSGSAGGQVDVGASPGVINVTGDWDNTGLDIALELDDLSASLAPGEEYDLLDITGMFTHGGSVTIDLSEFVAPTPQLLKLIGWGGALGNSGDTQVSFVGGGSLDVQYQSDGLYVMLEEVSPSGQAAVPEPSSGLLALSLAFVALLARRRGDR